MKLEKKFADMRVCPSKYLLVHSPFDDRKFDKDQPRKRQQNNRRDDPKLALLRRHPLHQRLKVEEFQVMVSIGVHVMADDMRQSPVAIVESTDVEAIHPPVVTLMKKIVSGDR